MGCASSKSAPDDVVVDEEDDARLARHRLGELRDRAAARRVELARARVALGRELSVVERAAALRVR